MSGEGRENQFEITLTKSGPQYILWIALAIYNDQNLRCAPYGGV